MKIIAYCRECGHKHTIHHDPLLPDRQVADWYTKHAGHKGVGFDWPGRTPKVSTVPFRGQVHPRDVKPVRTSTARRGNVRRRRVSGLVWPHERYVHDQEQSEVSSPVSPLGLFGLIDNADVKIAYAASASPTFTLASLAASSGLLSGREATATDNGASVKYLDYMVGGNFRAAASNNQAGSIYACAVAALNDTPTWFDGFDGTDSTLTVTKSGVFNAVCKFLAVIAADNTASQNWPFSGASVAGCFGGIVPDQFTYAVFHNIQTTTSAWNSAGNTFTHTPVYATVT